MKHVGKILKNNKGLEFIVLEFLGKERYNIKFIESGFIKKVTRHNMLNGLVKDPNFKNVFGVGFVGSGVYKTRENYKRTKASADWENMIARCYYPKNARYGSYGGKGVIVCEDWHNYQNFAEWHCSNYIDGFYLDKDIIGWNNKEYNADNCIYVPRYINNLLVHKNRGGYLFGVQKSGKRFRVQSSKCGDIGYFDSELEAHIAYSEYKLKHIKEVSKHALSVGDISNETYKHLMMFSIDKELGFIKKE